MRVTQLPQRYGSLLFAADGRTVICWGGNTGGAAVTFWEPGQAEPRSVEPRWERPLSCRGVSPDGTYGIWLAWSARDPNQFNTYRLIIGEVATGKQCAVLVPDERPVTTMAFTADGRTLTALMKRDGEPGWYPSLPDGRLAWRFAIPSGERLGEWPQKHPLWTTSVAVSPDGSTLALGESHSGKRVLFWDASGAVRKTTQHGGYVRDLVFAPDGERLGVVSGTKVRLWNVRTAKRLAECAGHRGKVLGLAFHPSGELLATAGQEGMVKFWSTAGACRATFDWQLGEAMAVAFAPDGILAAAAGSNGRVVVWDVDV